MSHGESSGVISQCLSAGTPVISNMPATADWPDDVLIKLPFTFAPEMLVDAVHRIVDDGDRQAALSRNARVFAARHSFNSLADALLKHLGH